MDEAYFSQQTVQVLEFFDKWFYSMKPLEESGFEKRARFCELFDVFHEREGGDSTWEVTHHNCLGCNFNEGCSTILDFLQRFSGSSNVCSYLSIYTLLFYSQAERLGVIYKELGFCTKNAFDWQSFPSLSLIKHWANFFKHPKAYMYLHHPTYHIETDPGRPNFLVNGVIDSSFVKKFYRASADNEELTKQFQKGIHYKVFFPDLILLTTELCQTFNDIIPEIKKPENIELLRKYTLNNF